MEIKINDNPLELPEGATLADALTAAGIAPAGIATALNGTVVPSANRASTVLRPGDSVLIIKAFYGG